VTAVLPGVAGSTAAMADLLLWSLLATIALTILLNVLVRAL
jgi:hypothetical protein